MAAAGHKADQGMEVYGPELGCPGRGQGGAVPLVGFQIQNPGNLELSMQCGKCLGRTRATSDVNAFDNLVGIRNWRHLQFSPTSHNGVINAALFYPVSGASLSLSLSFFFVN